MHRCDTQFHCSCPIELSPYGATGSHKMPRKRDISRGNMLLAEAWALFGGHCEPFRAPSSASLRTVSALARFLFLGFFGFFFTSVPVSSPQTPRRQRQQRGMHHSFTAIVGQQPIIDMFVVCIRYAVFGILYSVSMIKKWPPSQREKLLCPHYKKFTTRYCDDLVLTRYALSLLLPSISHLA